MSETRDETIKRLWAQFLAPPTDDIPMPTIVGAVEFRRDQYGLRKCDWAPLLGMSQAHYGDFVRGRRPLPWYAASRAYKLGVPAEVLFQIVGLEARMVKA